MLFSYVTEQQWGRLLFCSLEPKDTVYGMKPLSSALNIKTNVPWASLTSAGWTSGDYSFFWVSCAILYFFFNLKLVIRNFIQTGFLENRILIRKNFLQNMCICTRRTWFIKYFNVMYRYCIGFKNRPHHSLCLHCGLVFYVNHLLCLHCELVFYVNHSLCLHCGLVFCVNHLLCLHCELVFYVNHSLCLHCGLVFCVNHSLCLHCELVFYVNHSLCLHCGLVFYVI